MIARSSACCGSMPTSLPARAIGSTEGVGPASASAAQVGLLRQHRHAYGNSLAARRSMHVRVLYVGEAFSQANIDAAISERQRRTPLDCARYAQQVQCLHIARALPDGVDGARDTASHVAFLDIAVAAEHSRASPTCDAARWSPRTWPTEAECGQGCS